MSNLDVIITEKRCGQSGRKLSISALSRVHFETVTEVTKPQTVAVKLSALLMERFFLTRHGSSYCLGLITTSAPPKGAGAAIRARFELLVQA
eukprot:scaffold47447_cov17-Prasinocladus_malaysianus.AAC.1